MHHALRVVLQIIHSLLPETCPVNIHPVLRFVLPTDICLTIWPTINIVLRFVLLTDNLSWDLSYWQITYPETCPSSEICAIAWCMSHSNEKQLSRATTSTECNIRKELIYNECPDCENNWCNDQGVSYGPDCVSLELFVLFSLSSTLPACFSAHRHGWPNTFTSTVCVVLCSIHSQ